ncbi:MAG: HDOD domain-containing protein [Desulfobacteraceae bacterium]|jgi:HD-like signal output (HDOD) protein
MKFIELLLSQIDELEPFPEIAHRVLELSQKTESKMSEIANVIQYDPMITADIIKMSNSAYFGLSRKVGSLKDAIGILGLDRIINLVLMKCSSKNYKGFQPGYELEEGSLWKKSASAAMIAGKIAREKIPESKARVFTAALLRDIGKVVLGQYVANKKDKIKALVEENSLSFDEAEKKVLGIDQGEMSALILKKWGFPDDMTVVVKNSYNPRANSKFCMESDIVYFAHNICLMLGIGVGADGLAYRFDNSVMKRLGFEHKDIEMMMADFTDSIKDLEKLIESV